MIATPRLAPAIVWLLASVAIAEAAPPRLPPVTRARLPNGLRVMIAPTSRLPLVDFRLVVGAGSVDDPAAKEGLAAFTAALLTQGAGRRSALQVAEDIAQVGGALEASASTEQIVVTCEVLKKDFATGLELLRDVVVSPTFPEEEVARERDATLAEIASLRNDAGAVADLAAGPFLFGQNPLAHPAIGWQKSVASLSRDDAVRFHAAHVRPDRAWLAVVGDVSATETVAALQRAFAGWAAPLQAPVEAYSAAPDTAPRRVWLIEKPEVTQAQIRLTCMGVPRNHPDAYPIHVANAILGEGFSSRLVDQVRVRQGLTYGIGSGFDMLRNAGSFSITTQTRNDMVRRTVEATLAEVKRLRDQGPSVDELQRAKRYLTGQYPLGLQAPDALAARLLDVEFYGLESNTLETFQSRIEAVTMEDARRALKSYFCADQLRILVVSDPGAVRKQLEGLGPIEAREPF